MKKLVQSAIVFAGQVLFAGAVLLFIPHVGRAQKGQPSPIPPPLNVKIVNAPAEPVPVTGTVNVGNLGTSPLSVRDVDNPAFQPVRFVSSFKVPEGKRLVIEYLSFSFAAENPCLLIIATLLEQAEGEERPSGLHEYFPQLVGKDGFDRFRYSLSQEVRAYVDEGKTVLVGATSSCGGGTNLIVNNAVTGYLVDKP